MPPSGDRLVGFSSNQSAGDAPEMTPAEEYDLAAASGANAHRIDLHWSFLEPEPPSGGVHDYRGAGPEHGYLDDVDARYQALRARGLRPILILSSAPSWAQEQPSLFGPGGCENGRDCWHGVEPAASRLSDWAQFASFVAARYPDAVFEIWNEPNLKAFYRPKPDPARYRRVFRWAYDAIKAVSPGAEVLSGGISGVEVTSSEGISQRAFIDGIYREGMKGSTDFRLSVHIYPTSTELGAGTRYARQWDAVLGSMRAHDDAGREVWVTETGITTSPAGPSGQTVYGYGQIATPAEQADVARRLFNRMMSMPGPDVRAVVFHTLVDRGGASGYSPGDPEYGYGFVRHSPLLEPKPAFCWMVGANPPGAPVRAYPGC